MPYVRDPDHYTRGAGAIQSIDKMALRGRARARQQAARKSARIDRKRLGLMGLGDGLIAGSQAPISSVPPTLQTLNAMLNVANQKIYAKGGTPGPSLGAGDPINATTVAALNAILASGMSPLMFIDARITPAWIEQNASVIVTGLQTWLGYGSGVVPDPGFIVGTMQPTSKFLRIPAQATPPTPPPPTLPPVTPPPPPPDVTVTPPGYAPYTPPGASQVVGGVRMWIASNPAVAIGGAALLAYLLFFRKKR